MAKQQHTRITRRLAGPKGRREVPIPGRRRLDIKKGNLALEVERSSNPQRIRQAIGRLRSQPNARKELRVPQNNLNKATEIAKQVGTPLTVKNLGGTRRRRVS